MTKLSAPGGRRCPWPSARCGKLRLTPPWAAWPKRWTAPQGKRDEPYYGAPDEWPDLAAIEDEGGFKAKNGLRTAPERLILNTESIRDSRVDGRGPRWHHDPCMAASLRSTCSSCGPIEVPMDEAELVLVVDHSGRSERHLVEFSCPACARRGFEPLDERATRLLSAAGIRVVLTTTPASGIPAGQASQDTRH